MERYAPNAKDMATRDVVSRSRPWRSEMAARWRFLFFISLPTTCGTAVVLITFLVDLVLGVIVVKFSFCNKSGPLVMCFPSHIRIPATSTLCTACF